MPHPPGIRRSHPYPHKAGSRLPLDFWRLPPVLHRRAVLLCKIRCFSKFQDSLFHWFTFFLLQIAAEITDLYFSIQVELDAGEEPDRKAVSNRLDMQFPKEPVQGIHSGQPVSLYNQPAKEQAV